MATVTATCDAPGCGKTVAAVPPTFGAVGYAFPQEWWIQASVPDQSHTLDAADPI